MNTDEQSIQLLTALAARLRDDPKFMAHTLAVYQQRQGLDDGELAEELGALPEMLLRLALCHRPATDAPDFAEQVRKLADFTLMDEAQLARVIQRVDQLAEVTAFPHGFRAHWLAGVRTALAALAPTRVPLLAGAVCLIFFAVTGVLLWRAYRQAPAPNIAQHSPQPATTRAAATMPNTPAPNATAAQNGGNPITATPQPETLLVKVDLEDYLSFREAASGEGVKAIHLPAARTRLLLRLPENSGKGWYHASIVDEYDKPLAEEADAKSLDGKRLNVILDLRKLAAQSCRLRLWRANGAPDYYSVRIAAQQRTLRRKP